MQRSTSGSGWCCTVRHSVNAAAMLAHMTQRTCTCSAESMKTSPGADAPGDVPIYAYLFQGLAGSGSVGSQPRFGLEMSSHGADGFGTGRDEAL